MACGGGGLQNDPNTTAGGCTADRGVDEQRVTKRSMEENGDGDKQKNTSGPLPTSVTVKI
eukprot:1121873-Prymnesium_polylepis.1